MKRFVNFILLVLFTGSMQKIFSFAPEGRIESFRPLLESNKQAVTRSSFPPKGALPSLQYRPEYKPPVDILPYPKNKLSPLNKSKDVLPDSKSTDSNGSEAGFPIGSLDSEKSIESTGSNYSDDGFSTDRSDGLSVLDEKTSSVSDTELEKESLEKFGLVDTSEKTSMVLPQSQESFTVMKNSTGMHIAFAPSVYDVANVKLMEEKNLLVWPTEKFAIPKKMILRAREAKVKIKGSEMSKSPVVIVAYADGVNSKFPFKASLDLRDNGNLVFQTSKRYYYENIDSQKEIIENGLPYPSINIHDNYLYPWYPFQQSTYPRELDPSAEHEFYINRVKTVIKKGSKEFTHVVEYLDIREVPKKEKR